MGTATEQSLRNILKELESDTLPTDAATETTLAACKTALQLIDDLRNALGSVNTDDLQVDVKTSALPTDAATSAKQDTMITALELIDDLRNVLGSVGTDTLEVEVIESLLPDGAATEVTLAEVSTRLGDEITPAAGTVNKQLADILTELGAKLETADLNLDATKDLQVDVKTMPTTTVQAGGGDKIFSFESIVEQHLSDSSLDAGYNTLNGNAVPSGKVWMITTCTCVYVGTVPTRLRLRVEGLALSLWLKDQPSPVSDQRYNWSGQVYLQEGDYIQLDVVGATAGDYMSFQYAGIQMDAP